MKEIFGFDLAVAYLGFRILVQWTFTTGGFVKLRL